MKLCEAPATQSRDSIKDIWGKRTPYKHEWPARVDEAKDEEPEEWVPSACVLCSNGCGLDIGVKNGRVVGVRGRATDRVNKGRLGPKGLHGWKSIHHDDRLKHPLIRRNGRLEQASWGEAMDLIVQKSNEIIERLTRHGIGFYTSGQLFLEEYYALALIGKGGLHTLHMDGNTRLCTATAATSMRETFGSDGQPGSYTDIDHTDCLFMVGHNMAATQTVLWSRILDRLEGPDPPKLVVIDPRRSETAERATVHLAPRIGTNIPLLNGIQHLLFKKGWIEEGWLAEHVVGLDELKKTVAEYPPDVVETITGVPADQLEKAAEIIGTTKRLLSTALQGVYQSNQATASACQINNINLLRGLIGKPGSGVLQMNGQPTAQNNREAGCDGEYPGFRNHLNTAHMQELADIWNIDYIKCPHWNEPTHIQNLLNYISKGTIEMLWVSGTNPLVSLPNVDRVRHLLTKDNLFLIVQDIYKTETTAIADVVLPAAQWGEKTGCFTNVDRTVHLSQKAVDPPGEAKSDLDIFLMYARRMGFKDKDGNDLLPWTQPEEVFEAWKKLSKGRPCDYSAMTYKRLGGDSGIQWPCNEENPNGKERLFTDGQFFTNIEYCESFGHDLETGTPFSKDEYTAMNPNGRAILKACHYILPMEEPDEEYPFTLSTGRRVHHFHTRTKTGRTQLQKACPEPEIVISQEDATFLGCKDGDEVLVQSRRGKVELPITVGDIEKGQTFIPFHFGYFDAMDGKARAANELTLDTWDPVSKQPNFKSGAIKISKLPSRLLGEVEIHAREKQTSTEERASQKCHAKPSEESPCQRQLERWFGELLATIDRLIEIYTQLVPQLIKDLEIQNGLRIMSSIAGRMRHRLSPIAERYHEDRAWGKRRANVLADLLFPQGDELPGSYEALETLQGLYTYLSHIRAALTGMVPTSQALWDSQCTDCIEACLPDLRRMEAWVLHQLKVRAPQSLLVPVPL